MSCTLLKTSILLLVVAILVATIQCHEGCSGCYLPQPCPNCPVLTQVSTCPEFCHRPPNPPPCLPCNHPIIAHIPAHVAPSCAICFVPKPCSGCPADKYDRPCPRHCPKPSSHLDCIPCGAKKILEHEHHPQQLIQQQIQQQQQLLSHPLPPSRQPVEQREDGSEKQSLFHQYGPPLPSSNDVYSGIPIHHIQPALPSIVQPVVQIQQSSCQSCFLSQPCAGCPGLGVQVQSSCPVGCPQPEHPIACQPCGVTPKCPPAGLTKCAFIKPICFSDLQCPQGTKCCQINCVRKCSVPLFYQK